MQLPQFNKVYIIESLPEDELKTGTQLYESTLSESWCLESQLFAVGNKDEWDQALDEIRIDCSTNGRIPIIHLEIHGDAACYGLVLTDNTTILWKDLSWEFHKINDLTQCNLFVTLAVCHGAWLASAFSIINEMPFCGLLGSFDTIIVKDLEERFRKFYEDLSSNNDLDNALLELQQAGDKKADYRFIPADALFCMSYDQYVKEQCQGEKYNSRARKAIKQEYSGKDRNHLARLIAAFKSVERRSRSKYFEQYRKEYFMLEKYPDNENKFDIPKSIKELDALAKKYTKITARLNHEKPKDK